MENGDIKVCQMQARKVTQDVLMSVWYKQDIIETKTKFTFLPEILNNLCDLVTIELVRNGYVWEDFLKNHFGRMTRTPYLFANYFAYASYILIEEENNAHACFINILSLVTHFTLHCWQMKNEDKKFLNLCLELFCAFFDKELCEKFEHQGRWKNFIKYLKNQDILKRYREQNRPDKTKEIYIEFQSRHESNEPYIINSVALKKITLDEVENDKKALGFADLVENKIKEVFNKNFEEILKDFSKIDRQLEELYQETVSETSDGLTIAKDHSSLDEVRENALKNASSKIDLEKDKEQNNEFKENEVFKEVLKDFPKTDSQNVPSKIDPKKDEDQSKKIKENTAIKETSKDFPKMDGQIEKQNRETVGLASGEIASGGDKSSPKIQEAVEKVPGKSKHEKIEGKASISMKTWDEDSLKPLDLSPASKESDPSPKLTKLGRAAKAHSDSKETRNKSPASKESDLSPELTKLGRAAKALSDSLKSKDLSQEPKELDPCTKLTKAERAKALLKEMMTDITKIIELIKFVCEDNAVEVPKQVVSTVNKL